MKQNRIMLIISANNPNKSLIDYTRDLSLNDIDLIVVDDGSDAKYSELFDKIVSEGHLVLRHAKKMGHGRSLKTAINHMMNKENLPPYIGIVVTSADAVNDIETVLKLEKEMTTLPNFIILARQNVNYDNIRTFDKVFNRFTSFMTRWIYGKKIIDNFTNLRAYPISLIGQILATRGEDLDLEARFLAKAMDEGIAVKEIRLDNNYHVENKGKEYLLEKFKVFKQIISPFAKYSSISIITALTELLLFKILTTLFLFFNMEKDLIFIFVSIFFAKSMASILNIVLNKNYKYKNSGRKKITFYRHLLINFIKLGLSSYLIYILMNKLAYDEVRSKILVDILLFLLFYKIVYSWVFSSKNKKISGEGYGKEKRSKN
ncbi:MULTISPECIES: glycosyltransferase [unclassified Gemella]|uniref:glycosyltransferase n=1 Tax=unclassified Gemella TaxID=2624949 RepID=UPI0015D0770A|nr:MULTISPECIES: glycosyltransferase [unclassified Gemella]MBF0710517.1 glycosyltransferase [Gemella sp. GL1.1]NYS27861.1 glycosyltransferase [Gemella sp. GL1]